jgi:hypothetical protein
MPERNFAVAGMNGIEPVINDLAAQIQRWVFFVPCENVRGNGSETQDSIYIEQIGSVRVKIRMKSTKNSL